MRNSIAVVALLVLGLPFGAYGQDQATQQSAVTLDTVHVIGKGRSLASFPGSIDIVDADALHQGQKQISLSESLARVPGISALDRQNYAQDLQIQSRGFGARSTFGIRGIQILIDDIPATAPDGQGQASTASIGALDRIEVLRGPLALQYGNAAGGVIIGTSQLNATKETVGNLWAGSDDSYRSAIRLDGSTENSMWRLHGSAFNTDGQRNHSAAQRFQSDAIAEWQPTEAQSFRFVFNQFSQPESQDPLGLTREAFETNPTATAGPAVQFDTRKSISNQQLGGRWRIEKADGEAWLSTYAIQRVVEQYLAVPVAAQMSASSAGGVIDLARTTFGADFGLRKSWSTGSVAVGAALSRLYEDRRGYENFVFGSDLSILGIKGRLRRDEDNQVENRDVYVIGDYAIASSWTLLSGLRQSRLKFISRDRYVAFGNGDDSGKLDYAQSAWSTGIARAFKQGEIFMSFGRGYETPTVNELAYRPDGASGFNIDLRVAHNESAEVGLRVRTERFNASAAMYAIRGEDEIVPATSSGGRASFSNAGKTRRDGVELGATGSFSKQWSYAASLSSIRARFVEPFTFLINTGDGFESRRVESGNTIPGIPRFDSYLELAWHSPSSQIEAALENRLMGAITADDLNTDRARSDPRHAIRLIWRLKPNSHYALFARIDNLLDQHYVGSLIVNEGNRRFFEPGATRTIAIGFERSAASK